MTRFAVAVALGVRERTVFNWERGINPPPGDMLILLSRIYRRRPEDLLRVA